MTLPINLSTGPVNVSPEVLKALATMPFSHRSREFSQLYKRTTNMLCDGFNVKNTFLVTGSGTVANECMLQEIRSLGGQGLILSNGEFGTRLIDQAKRINISFLTLEQAWGEVFDMARVGTLIQECSIKWILFTHCETSTGVINDLAHLSVICKLNGCGCFVDCMSTAGTREIDLSLVTMATASSGKGLASIPGLAIIFSNGEPLQKDHCPSYVDLANYDGCDGVPFTLSSNLLAALHVAIGQKINEDQFVRTDAARRILFSALSQQGLVPFATNDSSVFTLVPRCKRDDCFIDLLQQKLTLSSNSDYLKKRGWYQLAVFGRYCDSELQDLQEILQTATKRTYAGSGAYTLNNQ